MPPAKLLDSLVWAETNIADGTTLARLGDTIIGTSPSGGGLPASVSKGSCSGVIVQQDGDIADATVSGTWQRVDEWVQADIFITFGAGSAGGTEIGIELVTSGGPTPLPINASLGTCGIGDVVLGGVPMTCRPLWNGSYTLRLSSLGDGDLGEALGESIQPDDSIRIILLYRTATPPLFVFSAANPPDGVDSEPYSYQFSTSGAPGATFSSAGPLPDGLTLSASGLLSGTPTVVDSFTFTVVATNGVPPDASATVTVDIAASGGGGGGGGGGGTRPDSTNTGHVAAGTAIVDLVTYAGPSTISSPTTLTDQLFDSGQINVDVGAGNTVHFVTCRFETSDLRCINVISGIVICDDCTGDGQNATHEFIYGSDWTLNRCWIFGTENGIVQVDNAFAYDCFIDNSADNLAGAHYDGAECNGGNNNGVVRCTILGHANQTSAVMTNNFFGACTNYLVDNCWLSGGAYVFYADGRFNASAMTATVRNTVFEDAGDFGRALIAGTAVVTQSGNVDGAGNPVTL